MPPEAVNVALLPIHNAAGPLMVATGNARTAISKVTGAPVQAPNTGVTVTMAFCPAASAVKLRLPAPAPGKPMAVLEFVQLKVVAAVPVTGTLSTDPTQTFLAPGLSATGADTTLKVKVRAGPGQVPEGVTVMTEVPGLLMAAKLILPVPLAGIPVDVLLLTQLNTGELPVKLMATGNPPQTA